MTTVFLLRFGSNTWGPYLSHSSVVEVVKHFDFISSYVVEEWYFGQEESIKIREIIEVENDQEY